MTSLEEIIDSRQAALAGALAEATEYTDSLLAPLDDDLIAQGLQGHVSILQ